MTRLDKGQSSQSCVQRWEMYYKVDLQRSDAIEIWGWRKYLRVPWTARRSKGSILKEISPKYWLEGLMLKLELEYFGHLMWKTDLLEKTLIAGSRYEELQPWQRSWGRRLGIHKGEIEPQESPWIFSSIYPPKPEFAYFTALCSHLWLYWGLSPTTISLSLIELTYSSS